MPSRTTILLLDVHATGMTSTEATQALAAAGVIVVNCRLFKGLESQDFLRISIGAHRENCRLVEALAELLGRTGRHQEKGLA